jgi:ubiquinol-cytochrome c reductase subunit 6
MNQENIVCPYCSQRKRQLDVEEEEEEDDEIGGNRIESKHLGFLLPWEFRSSFLSNFAMPEEDVVDQKRYFEESCKPKCVKPLLEYQACVKRIQDDESGHKHCTGQYFDYWHCVDKCVSVWVLFFCIHLKFRETKMTKTATWSLFFFPGLYKMMWMLNITTANHN